MAASFLLLAIVAHGSPRIVVLGDSVGRGLGAFMQTANLGINGARTANVLALLKRAEAQSAIRSASAIVLSIGGNDLYGDSAARLWTTIWPSHAMNRTLDRIESIVARLHRLNPTARLCLIGLYDPYRNRSLDTQVALWDSRLIARFANDHAVQVLRIADLFVWRDRLSPADRFHPSAEAYALIAARVWAVVTP